MVTDDQDTHALSNLSKECLFCVVLTPLETQYKAVSKVLSRAYIQQLVIIQ